MKFLIYAASVCLLCTIVWAAFVISSERVEFVQIGGYSWGTDPGGLQFRFIEDAFRQNRIEYSMYGSIGYTVSVNRSDSVRAKAIMREVISKHGLNSFHVDPDKK